jgi:hypothetical protein
VPAPGAKKFCFEIAPLIWNKNSVRF